MRSYRSRQFVKLKYCDCVSLLFIAILFLPTYALSDTVENNEINTPSHVYALVKDTQFLVEQLRVEMGKPKSKNIDIIISGASPREVYFQALTMFRKANRLSYEITRAKESEPLVPGRDIAPKDVLNLVKLTNKSLEVIKDKLGIVEEISASSIEEKISDDVFVAILRVNTQLNVLLERQFSSSDVYQLVTHAISYASRILESFPVASKTIPEAKAYQRGKNSADVYAELASCLFLIKDTAAIFKLKMLDAKISEVKPETVTPSDVYDLASLIVSELAYLHSQLSGAKLPHRAYFPGRKFPSHVYQRVGILSSQLRMMQNYAVGNPGRLSGR